METPNLADITALKQRILRHKDKAHADTNTTSTYVTRSGKISQPTKKDQGLTFCEEHTHETYTHQAIFLSSFLNFVLNLLSGYANLTYRSIQDNSREQIEITRCKPDINASDGTPISAARVFVKDDGLCQFSLITGFVEELQVDIFDESASSVAPFLEKLSDNYVFCYGLPKTLPEVKCYNQPFQFSQDYPYPHVRSKHCFLWYKYTKGISIRERQGRENPRCSACKKYWCIIARSCRLKQEKQKTGKLDGSKKDRQDTSVKKDEHRCVNINTASDPTVRRCRRKNISKAVPPKRKRRTSQAVNVYVISEKELDDTDAETANVSPYNYEFSKNTQECKEGNIQKNLMEILLVLGDFCA